MYESRPFHPGQFQQAPSQQAAHWLARIACLLLALVAAPGLADARDRTPGWDYENSDIPVDPGFRFGQLANGMRYVLRHNERPSGVVLVRMEVAAGSLDERDNERGYAHFVEHMAFQGSSHVPTGEMIRLLERKGLAFGADTNASTSFEQTTYILDLPRKDPGLLDTALMLMRETVSELGFDPAQVARERGVVLAEMRDRNTWSYREMENRLAFVDPRAHYVRRLPIGTAEALTAANAASLRAFWVRNYVPSRTTVVVIGDIDPDKAEKLITEHFGDWQPRGTPAQPSPGPVNPRDHDRTGLYIDPALSERVTISRHGRWLDEPDTTMQRREDLLRRIGYGVLNRRLGHLARRADPPYRDAGFGTGDVFQAGRTTNLVVDVIDGQWQRGLAAASAEYRRALTYGFTASEIAEQVANIRNRIAHAAAAADTRSSYELVDDVLDLLRNGVVPSPPRDALTRFAAFAPQISPAAVLGALKREAVALGDSQDRRHNRPLIRFQGRTAPVGGIDAVRIVWNEAMRGPLAREGSEASGGFGYTSFGTAGIVVADSREPRFGIRQVRFANGVRLNLKHTDLDRDRVLVEMQVDGGSMLATRANPLAVTMVPSLAAGGLGKHSQDDLETLLAGHTVNTGLGVGSESFIASANTTPADLGLQLQLMAAFLSDPGYRAEGEMQFRAGIDNWFSQLRATPASALTAAIGGILSDEDPRFTTQPAAAYTALGFQRLRKDIADRLGHGAIEIGMVGDLDEAAAIGLVARTLGALPPREADFRSYGDRRERPYTANRTPRTVTHTGAANQALLRYTWLTRDDADPVEKQVLNLLDRVVRLELTETLRQRLGKAYSPGSASELSRTWKGYGTFAVAASVDVGDLAATRTAIAETVANLRNQPVADDVLLRARAPLAEAFENQLKSNGGWLGLVARAQTLPDRIDRQILARDRLLALTSADIQSAAQRYLTDDRMVEINVLPQGLLAQVDQPKAVQPLAVQALPAPVAPVEASPARPLVILAPPAQTPTAPAQPLAQIGAKPRNAPTSAALAAAPAPKISKE